MTLAEMLARGVTALKAAGIDGAARDARLLLAHCAGVAPGRLTLHLPDAAGPGNARAFETALVRRSAGEPVSRIVGKRAFHGHDFAISPAVLDPRPETETLVALALQAPFGRVLDLGTGSGCILLSLLADRPEAHGTGTDISEDALAVARDNAETLGLRARASWLLADWWDGVAGTFDLIVSNPPYIAAAEMDGLAREVRDHDPALALSPGGDGLAAYRAIAHGAARHLAPDGRLIVEIGEHRAPAVREIFSAAGLASIGCHHDMDGRERVMTARSPAKPAC